MSGLERLGGEQAVVDGVLEEFRGLCAVPHPPRHEAAVSARYRSRLEALGLSPVSDELGNLMAEVPAAPGREAAPRVILQGHMDMVCAVKPGSGFDPLTSPVKAVVSDGVLRSDGSSSLGADNGLGNAALLWLLGRKIAHGPLRIIFTVAEEVGLRGAGALSPAWLQGADYLINTDGFRLGRLVLGSAGGRRETFTRPLERVPAGEMGLALELALSGFTGGHSGNDIGRGGGNPIKELTRFLLGLEFPWSLAALEGGLTHNAIPTGASAVLVAEERYAGRLAGAVDEFWDDLTACFGETDPRLTVAFRPVKFPRMVWRSDCAADVLLMLDGLFSGVYAMSGAFPGVVSASANLGRVRAADGTVELCAFIRCAERTDEETLAGRHRKLAVQFGFETEAEGYPAWTGRPDNSLALRMAEIYRRETGREAELTAVHMGLELSFFQEKAPGLVMVSAGPDIFGAHSVDERAPLASLPPYAALLAGTLEDIGKEEKR